MPPLLADFIYARAYKPICEKLLTLPGYFSILVSRITYRHCKDKSLQKTISLANHSSQLSLLHLKHRFTQLEFSDKTLSVF